MRVQKRLEEENEFGTVECCDRSGVLKVLSWNVAGLAEDCTDIFLSQISMLADYDVLLLQECFRKLDGVNVGAHELFTPSELLRGLRCPAVIVDRKWKGQSKIVGGAARAGWTADPHFSTLASQRKKTGRIRGCFDGNPRVLEWETQKTCDPGRRLQCEPVWQDRLSPCGRIDPETENVDRHKRCIACESFAHDGDRTGFDGDKHVDECRHRTRAFHAFQLSNPEDSLTRVDFIMTSRKLEMKHVQVLDSDWFKTDHRAVYAVLSLRPKMRYTMTNAANLRGWVPDDSWHDAAAATLTDWKSWNKLAPLLVETAKAHRKVESKEMSVTEMELKTLLLRKKKQVDTSNDQN